MKKYVENNFASFRLEKGILHICYKEDVSLLLQSAMEIVALRLIFQQGKPYPILCNMRGVRYISLNAQKYFAVEGSLLIMALALISKSPLAMIYSKLYIKEAPPIKIKMFPEEPMALEFLSPFVLPDSD